MPLALFSTGATGMFEPKVNIEKEREKLMKNNTLWNIAATGTSIPVNNGQDFYNKWLEYQTEEKKKIEKQDKKRNLMNSINSLYWRIDIGDSHFDSFKYELISLLDNIIQEL